MPKVDIGDAEIHYEEAGSGDPIMFVPGLGGGGAVWTNQIPAFSDGYRTIVHDHRGCGQSTYSRIEYSVDQMADDAIRLMDKLGIEKAHVVGRSMGGAVAQHMALKAPERLQSMALAASFARLDPLGSQVIANLQQLLTWRKSWAEWAPHAVYLFVAPGFYNANADLMAKITALVSGEDRDMVSYDNLATACIEHDVLDRLSEVKTPTLVMGGRFDPICSMTAQNWMMDQLPNAELEVFENSSHFFLMEEAEKAMTSIEAWFKKNAA